MNYRYLKVNPQLEEYLRTVLVFDSCSDTEGSDLPLFTKGMPTLLFKTEGNDNQITLFGQSVPDEKCTVENNTTLIAFFFKPFALGTIFKLSAQELKEKPIELNIWNAQKAMTLNVQLFHSKSTKEKIEILNHFILSQIQANRRECEIILYATDKLMQNSNADVLSQILQDLSLTERTFQRLFKKYVGITANEYRRICQFYFAFSQLKGGHFDKLTDVAYANGYFDQSHYIRSFKEFTDVTPNEYLQSGLSKKVE
jgi:AraC-like DNA-binding protein